MSGVAGAAASGRWGWTRQFEPGSRRGLAMATVAVVALAVLVSLLRGQDTNWDLRNYHLYNAWAWLNGRIATDLAPAQLQSYFTPLLDVPYYLLVQHAPAPVAGVFLGILHGLAFLPLCWIAWRILAGEQERGRKAFLLALAGMCGGPSCRSWAIRWVMPAPRRWCWARLRWPCLRPAAGRAGRWRWRVRCSALRWR